MRFSVFYVTVIYTKRFDVNDGMRLYVTLYFVFILNAGLSMYVFALCV